MAKAKSDEAKELAEKQDGKAPEQSVKEGGTSNKKAYQIRNPQRANQTVYGVTGKPVTFDSDGIAEVESADYDHFPRVPGYSRV